MPSLVRARLKALEKSVRGRIPTVLRDTLRPLFAGRSRRRRRWMPEPPVRPPVHEHASAAVMPAAPGAAAVMQPGLVSVIIPIYDRTFELREAIESVLAQTYRSFEILLVTDGSPPETIDVVESYRGHPQIRIFHYLDNTGTAVRGRNRGIKEARGEYVAFLDSDDIATPDRLAISVHEMEAGGHDVVYGGWIAKIDGSRAFDDLHDGQKVTSPPCDLEMLRKVCVPCQSTVMVRRAALLDVGGLKPAMRYREDHELWMRLAHYGYRFGAIRDSLVHLRLHRGNNEVNFKADDAHWERRAQEEHRHKATLPPTIAYLIPGTGISGGIAVILEHANRLLEAGCDVLLISQDNKDSIPWWSGNEVPVIPFDTASRYLFDRLDTVVATGWTTVSMVDHFPASRKLYFVQSDERRFDECPEFKKQVHATYLRHDVEYVTMAGWICRWLKQEFGHACSYVGNGIDPARYAAASPLEPRSDKVRILMEGPTVIPFKGMDDAAEALRDFADCEVWMVSAAGGPKPGWRCDRFFEAVPHDQMAAIYASCDVLLKMSRVESFSYPPLEMMARGGGVVVRDVTGLDEYAVDGKNCLIVSDVASARSAVRRLVDDVALRAALGAAGRATAARMTWDRSLPALLRIVAGGFQPPVVVPPRKPIDVLDVMGTETERSRHAVRVSGGMDEARRAAAELLAEPGEGTIDHEPARQPAAA
ncbi:MAG: glycosyltransferase [Pirellulales bacterium]